MNFADFATTCNYILFVSLSFRYICCVNGAQDDTLSTPTTPVFKCGDMQKMVDECFRDLPPHLMEFLQTTKIAVDEQEIASKCIVFKRGMSCFDDYTTHCLSSEQFILFKNNVAGARRFLVKFCEDRKFQEDYLKHKDCFTHIQEDWNRCTTNFQNILTEELHGVDNEIQNSNNMTVKFMHFCCTRHAYENCIYNSARYKCYNHSAQFARDAAQMLSEEKHFSNCRHIEGALCAASAEPMRRLHQPVVSVVLLSLWLVIQFVSLLQATDIK